MCQKLVLKDFSGLILIEWYKLIKEERQKSLKSEDPLETNIF